MHSAATTSPAGVHPRVFLPHPELSAHSEKHPTAPACALARVSISASHEGTELGKIPKPLSEQDFSPWRGPAKTLLQLWLCQRQQNQSGFASQHPQTLEQLGCLGHDSAGTELHQAVCKQKKKTTQMKTISSSFLSKLCIWAEGKNWKVEIQCKV